MTQWFQRFVQQTFRGKDLMTEETLQALREDIARLRTQLAEVFHEVVLAMQAMDLIDERLKQSLPLVLPAPPPAPVLVPIASAPQDIPELETQSLRVVLQAREQEPWVEPKTEQPPPVTLTRDMRQRESALG